MAAARSFCSLLPFGRTIKQRNISPHGQWKDILHEASRSGYKLRFIIPLSFSTLEVALRHGNKLVVILHIAQLIKLEWRQLSLLQLQEKNSDH